MASRSATLRPEFDGPIGGADDIKVVFDHNQGGSCIA
jgi:hypothetical protein